MNNKLYFSINNQVHTILNCSCTSRSLRILSIWQSACTPPRLYDKSPLAARSVSRRGYSTEGAGVYVSDVPTYQVTEKKQALKYTLKLRHETISALMMLVVVVVVVMML